MPLLFDFVDAVEYNSLHELSDKYSVKFELESSAIDVYHQHLFPVHTTVYQSIIQII